MDYFATLTKDEIKVNRVLLEAFERQKARDLIDTNNILNNTNSATSNKTNKTNNTNPDITKKEKIKKINLDNIEDNLHGKLFKIGYDQLNDFQKPIIKEACDQGFGGLALCVGSGKTILSIVLGLYLTMKTEQPILIVVSKSLIETWEEEIEKFYGDQLKYQVVHPTTVKEMGKWKIKAKIILTTVDVISKYYKENSIDKLFIKQVFPPRFGNYVNHYQIPTEPYMNHVIGGGLFYSIQWGTIIIDEAQTYTNIDTLRCQCLGALYSNHRWLLSGTLFDEPKIERILGYHIMLNAPGKPRNLPETKELVTDKKLGFKGLNEYQVYRASNLAFKPPIIHEEIITHVLLPEEEKIYTMMKTILIQVKAKADKAKLLKNAAESKKFSSYKLVMIMYLRQALICPLIPITSIIIDASDLEKRSELSKIIVEEIKKLNIDDYLANTKSIKSTRMKATIQILEKHKKDRTIVFSCFKSYLDIMTYLLKDKMNLFVMRSEMSSKERGNMIDKFRESKNGVLLMTYELGSTGLNLQCAKTVLFADTPWCAGRNIQGIGRIVRYGQLSPEVNIYFFSANTGIENIIYQKQYFKLQKLDELKTGTSDTKIPKIRIDDVIRMIDIEDNRKRMADIKYI